ncbi:MAG: DUF779 domain-containing protein [Nitrospirae bacterium]|nr:MAG: DUF779 domain-containing protein [Nitrospirota bacterium]
MPKRITITDRAGEVINKLKEEHGSLMFHLSGGCCDGSSPMCFRVGEFKIGESDVLLGEIEGCPFYVSDSHLNIWKNSELTLDVVKGRGSSFSLEIPLGVRFIVHSKITNKNTCNIEGK